MQSFYSLFVRLRFFVLSYLHAERIGAYFCIDLYEIKFLNVKSRFVVHFFVLFCRLQKSPF